MFDQVVVVISDDVRTVLKRKTDDTDEKIVTFGCCIACQCQAVFF